MFQNYSYIYCIIKPDDANSFLAKHRPIKMNSEVLYFAISKLYSRVVLRKLSYEQFSIYRVVERNFKKIIRVPSILYFVLLNKFCHESFLEILFRT